MNGWGSSRTTEIVPLEENARGGRAFLAISGLKVLCFLKGQPVARAEGGAGIGRSPRLQPATKS
jgi:hypothetical protein